MATVTRQVVGKEQRAAIFHALAKFSAKESESLRGDLVAGEGYAVSLQISATVNGGESEELAAHCSLSVGHDNTRASSTTPDVNHLVAAILAKLNAVTRQAILRDLPEEFAKNDNQLPNVGKSAIDEAAAMLVRLRAKKEQTVRGSVSCRYAISE